MANRFKISNISVEGRSRASAPTLRTFTISYGRVQTQQKQTDPGASEHMEISKNHSQAGWKRIVDWI